MIPVRGFKGAKVAVLGLGRTGMSAARALIEGGALPLCWDDNPQARARAQDEGFECTTFRAVSDFDDIACLIVSPGIAHLYPAPNPVVRLALHAGVPVDNDIGLFFQSFATNDWANFDTAAAGRGRHGVERKVDEFCADPSYSGTCGPPGDVGGQYRARCSGY